MRSSASPAARQASLLFVAGGVLRLAAVPFPGSRVTGLLLLALTNLLLAGIVWVLPWKRWPQSATLALTAPAFLVIVTSNAAGLIPTRGLAALFVLVFVWVGSNHRPGASFWVGPLGTAAYLVAVTVSPQGLPLDYRALVLVSAVCILVAETVARSQERLRATADEMLFLAEHATDLVTRTDLDGVIRYVSPSVRVLLGWEPEQLVGQLTSAFNHPEDPVPATVAAASSGQPVTLVRRLRRADGDWAWFESVAQLVTGPDGRREVLSSGRDVSARKLMEAELEHVATHDALTGLPNRVLLDAQLTECLSAPRSQPLAVAFLDLDGFKAVNDGHGHEVGDRLLGQVAKRLQQVIRGKDTAARYGGDEFVLLIDGLHQRDVLALIARVERELAEPYLVGEATLHIGASVGLTFVASGMSASQAIDAADRAMYTTKAARRSSGRVPAPRGLSPHVAP